MKRSKFTEAQIAFILRQAEEGTAVGEVCRKAGISEATYYNWRKKYAGLMPSEMKRLRLLEEENRRNVRQFSHNRKSTKKDRTGWLGREDSNLRMAESKSANAFRHVPPHCDIIPRTKTISLIYPPVRQWMPQMRIPVIPR